MRCKNLSTQRFRPQIKNVQIAARWRRWPGRAEGRCPSGRAGAQVAEGAAHRQYNAHPLQLSMKPSRQFVLFYPFSPLVTKISLCITRARITLIGVTIKTISNELCNSRYQRCCYLMTASLAKVTTQLLSSSAAAQHFCP